jgi:uncharacterized protein YceH (UPF0502 family)
MRRMESAGIVGLSSEELRVLGCLLEKQRTTPDQYPLSLNALRLACNQSTNRDPVVDYDESTIRDALHRLERRGLVRLASGAGSRAAKYRHLLAEALPLSGAEQAVMCVLMLRGPQTPGELKQRCERMHAFGSLEDVLATLGRLTERDLVASLGRRPGQKEERYRELIGAEDEEPLARELPNGAPAAALPSVQPGGLEQRVARLEREVAQLRALVGERQGPAGITREPEQAAEDRALAPADGTWEPAR